MHHPERAPAGWYPDPLGSTQVRWWNSHGWTEHTQASREAIRHPETIQVSSRLEWADPDEPELSEVGGQVVRMSAPTSKPTTSISSTVNSITAERPSLAPNGLLDREDSRDATGSVNGWLAVSFAVSTASPNAIIRVTAEEIPELLIDLKQSMYWCSVELSALPRSVGPLTVQLQSRSQVSTPTSAGRDLEPLLWMLGIEIDSLGPISGVNLRNRFKLRRWPNVTAIRQTSQQMQMTSLLANAFLTPAELAAITSSDLSDAIRLIATFELMGLVVELPEVAPSAVNLETLTVPPRSLARRIWETLTK